MIKRNELTLRWVDALRSGEYKQSKYSLRDGRGFCCLGVACDVSNVSEWKGDDYMGAYARLPETLVEKIGINTLEQRFLMEMNDQHGKTFPEIADYIESIMEPA